ncbi:unnamed protein product [Blepharisma stoltei]|uniref:RING-type domain-containing protein n=1 Tax=Blepharisma stoltei TaxID=1481888 RepID=A0AAU9JML1_9CILI|nr:unnamed protein product [Blepharisma stoltei]
MDERSPLVQNPNRSPNQSQGIVRENLYHTIRRVEYSSYLLMTFRLSVSTVKIISSGIVLSFFAASCNAPLAFWVAISLLLDIWYVIMLFFRIPHVKSVRDGGEINEGIFLSALFKLQTFAYLGWLIPGNIWYWSCKDCYDDAPVLTALVFALLILGYCYLMIPTMLLLCLCACLPVAIIFLMFISNTSQLPATEGMIKDLKSVEYDPVVNQGDSSCSICAVEYSEKDKIIVMECDPRHFFHEECIKRWLRINSNCPICRTPFLMD